MIEGVIATKYSVGNRLKTVVFIIIIFCLCIPAMAQKWQISENYKEEDAVYIKYGEVGNKSLDEIIKKIELNKTLKGIFLGRLLHLYSNELQSEINTYLKANYPNELKEALESAGNLHNPKIVALREPFKEAVSHTSFIKELGTSLKNYNYKIGGISLEKFFLIKKDEVINFDALTWLEVKKLDF